MFTPLFVITPTILALIGLAMSAVGGVGGAIWSQKKKLSKSQQQQNAFNSSEAEAQRIFESNEAALSRDWSAAEAERARDWNEEMYAKYNSLSGKISQAESAGVNPLFAVTGSAVSPVSASASAPSGSMAHGAAAGGAQVPSSADSFTALIGQLAGLMKIKSDIEVNEAKANKDNAEAAGQKITNESLRDMNASEIMSNLSQVELNDANIGLISAKILNTEADTEVKGAQLGQIASQIANTEADTQVKEQQVAVMLSEILKNEKSLDLIEAQIRECNSVAGVNRAKSSVLAQEFRNLTQEYGHQEVMNALTEITASRDSGEENAYYRSMSEVKRFINSLLGWWSGTTSIDVPHKKPAKIGFK